MNLTNNLNFKMVDLNLNFEISNSIFCKHNFFIFGKNIKIGSTLPLNAKWQILKKHLIMLKNT